VEEETGYRCEILEPFDKIRIGFPTGTEIN